MRLFFKPHFPDFTSFSIVFHLICYALNLKRYCLGYLALIYGNRNATEQKLECSGDALYAPKPKGLGQPRRNPRIPSRGLVAPALQA